MPSVTVERIVLDNSKESLSIIAGSYQIKRIMGDLLDSLVMQIKDKEILSAKITIEIT